jgi:hypothetical protein
MIKEPMKSARHLFAYLLLNILVSGITTACVLWLWEKSHTDCASINQPFSTLVAQINPSINTATPSIPTPQPTSPISDAVPPIGQPVIRVDTIIGVGDVGTEVIVISRIGEGELSLTGWHLLDEEGNEFIFPQLQLNKGKVEVYTRIGSSDLAKGLYWGKGESVWHIGETATILDSQGNVRATYVIP